MALPNPEQAVVDPDKVRDYLLSSAHPVGHFKAVFFRALGFSADQWAVLLAALLTTARGDDVHEGASGPFGQKYEVHATLIGPSGRSARVIVVWIVRNGEDFPRFVTAFPA